MESATVRPFLLISPYFAPQTSVGAFRWVKLARHLPRHGFRPVVLSATFPGDARDDGLLAALPPEVEVADAFLDPAVLAAEAAFAAVRARVPRRAGPGARSWGSARSGRSPIAAPCTRPTPRAWPSRSPAAPARRPSW
ncbi:uncharacterized protein SOCE836_015370 [Sorangium cellulosum]|uniref:Glycosyltransferase subfamily 4-like N-terminal domain-containing protein n=1 Tax=Sorangium cellulosum TaxID=56 RepID=A0A4P2QHJ3_SORCE|nr:hypothetical protein [Sorangium cellulosum]AUX29447.1 uncharacterized protein SOCE836_015370 [Sorangium cellulosum]